MKNVAVIQLIALVIVVATCLLITRAIVNSDMPLWLKFFLLK